jgi:hypothetical protein
VSLVGTPTTERPRPGRRSPAIREFRGPDRRPVRVGAVDRGLLACGDLTMMLRRRRIPGGFPHDLIVFFALAWMLARWSW